MNLQGILSSFKDRITGNNLKSPVPEGYGGGGFTGQTSTYPEMMNLLQEKGKQPFIHFNDLEEYKKAVQQMGGAVSPSVASAEELPAAAPQATAPADFNSLLNMAAQMAQKRGFPPQAIASQMAAESSRGTSRFAKERNNYFGIGAFDNDLDNTWRFDTPQESVEALLNLYETDPRYADAYANRQDPTTFVKLLAKTYASDPNYANMIMNTPEWRQFSN